MDPYARDGSTGLPAALPSSQLTPAMPAAVSQQPAQTGLAPVATPAVAADTDVIEAEWIAAVDRTLAATQNDPYSVNAAMAALRKDYLRKRYGKEAGQASQ